MTTPVYAGPYGDALSKCLISSTSVDDRNQLVQWMFSAASSHPAVSSFTAVSPAQLDSANKNAALLFEKLLTKSCKKETTEALKYEGEITISTAFNILGQVAGRELFSDPSVSKNLTGLNKYFDKSKLEALTE
jgi:hypothetical protein